MHNTLCASAAVPASLMHTGREHSALALLCLVIQTDAFRAVSPAPTNTARAFLSAPRQTRPSQVCATVGSAAIAGSPRVVVLGGGLAGLSVAYHLLNLTATTDSGGKQRRSPLRVSIVDQCAVGEGGASGAMAGLLHPLTPRGKKMWLGDEGMAASLELIQAAVDACPHRLVLSNRAGQRGIVRLVTKGEKQVWFPECVRACKAGFAHVGKWRAR